MNKKLLFGVMSLAALAACTNDDFDSQQQVAEGTSPVQFEVINNNASMRARLGDNDAVVFSATDGDLFTLYHGAATLGDLTGYQNATYKATNDKGTATLTTPSMILPGGAIMVWPADTTFRIKSDGALSVKIPNQQPEDIENYIPYVSDLIQIAEYAKYDDEHAYNTAGKDRKYPVYMRAMGSVLNLKADYDGTDKTIAELYEGGEAGLKGDDAIKKIEVKGVELLTKDATTTPFTTGIKIKFNDTPNPAWDDVPNNSWKKVTELDISDAGIIEKYAKLTTKKLLEGNQGCKFIMLPQKEMTITAADENTGVSEGTVVVNTNYGKVVVAPDGTQGGKYENAEIKGAWYRYIKDPSTKKDWETATSKKDAEGRTQVTTNISRGLGMTINQFATVTSTQEQVEGEMVGAAVERYVKVLLTHLDMSDLHVESDKQLRDAARVWEKMGLPSVTVYLDGGKEGDDAGEFTISQKTIKVINDINAAVEGGTKSFKVMPCNVEGEKCTNIVITGASDIQTLQNIAFIEAGDNGTPDNPADDIKANVVLANETPAWKWKVDSETKVASIKVQASAVNRFINKGTILNDADATLKTLEKNGTQNNVPLRNDGTWNITGGKLFVQFTVTNNGGTVNISKGAEYRQDGAGHVFYNWASTLPKRITKAETESIGLVNNYGVFATVNNGTINNYGLIEHKDVDAKTYISANDNGGAGFGTEFKSNNKIGRINLPYSNRNEDNISVNAALNKGFVSVTVTAEELAKEGVTSTSLDASVVGEKVNYIIVNSGITEISKVKSNILYLEIADADKKEIAWNVTENTEYDGLIVLSPVNITQGTTINVVKGNFLGADMYVGGKFTFNGAAVTKNSFKSYYGDTSDKFATLYVTY